MVAFQACFICVFAGLDVIYSGMACERLLYVPQPALDILLPRIILRSPYHMSSRLSGKLTRWLGIFEDEARLTPGH